MWEMLTSQTPYEGINMYSGGCVSVCVCSGTGKAMHGDPMYAHTLTHTHVCSPRTSALATVAYSIGLKGCTLPIPTSCPSEITHVLKRCWNLRPRDRPGFAGEAFEAETEAETETETDRDRYCLSVCLSVSLTLTLLTDPPPSFFPNQYWYLGATRAAGRAATHADL